MTLLRLKKGVTLGAWRNLNLTGWTTLLYNAGWIVMGHVLNVGPLAFAVMWRKRIETKESP